MRNPSVRITVSLRAAALFSMLALSGMGFAHSQDASQAVVDPAAAGAEAAPDTVSPRTAPAASTAKGKTVAEAMNALPEMAKDAVDPWSRELAAAGQSDATDPIRVNPSGETTGSGVTDLLTALTAIAFLAAAVVALRHWQRRVANPSSHAATISILARHALGSNTGMMVVKVRQEEMLVGYGAGGLTLIKTLEPSGGGSANPGSAEAEAGKAATEPSGNDNTGKEADKAR